MYKTSRKSQDKLPTLTFSPDLWTYHNSGNFCPFGRLLAEALSLSWRKFAGHGPACTFDHSCNASPGDTQWRCQCNGCFWSYEGLADPRGFDDEDDDDEDGMITSTSNTNSTIHPSCHDADHLSFHCHGRYHHPHHHHLDEPIITTLVI